MPGLNELFAARIQIFGSSAHTGKIANGYSKLKREYEAKVRWYMARKKLSKAPFPCWMSYLVIEPNQMRDPSNIVAGAMKLIEDSIKGKVIEDDSWAYIKGITAWWDVAPEPGVLVAWGESGFSKEEMRSLYVRFRSPV